MTPGEKDAILNLLYDAWRISNEGCAYDAVRCIQTAIALMHKAEPLLEAVK